MTDLFPESDTLRNAGFADFWAQVPQGAKSGKAVAEKAYRKLTPPRRKEARDKVATYYAWWRQQNPQASWLHPGTYLNQRRWEDEAFAPKSETVQVKDRAAYWADHINKGRAVSRFTVTPTLLDEMVQRGLVDKATLRERGLG